MKKLLFLLLLTSSLYAQFEPFDFFNPPLQKETIAHIARVKADGGTVTDKDGLDRAIQAMKFDRSWTLTRILADPNWGVKADASGYVSKLYNVMYKESADLLKGWDFTSGWTVVSATINNATTFTTSAGMAGAIRKSNTLTIGKKYELKISGVSSSSNFSIRTDDGSTTTLIGNITSSVRTFSFTADKSNLYLRNADNGTSTLTRFELYEVLNPDLEQSVAANQPKLIVYKDNSGANTQRRTLLFDGSNDYLKTASMTLVQPEVVYMGVRNISWVSQKAIIDGYSSTNRMGVNQAGSDQQIPIYAGAGGPSVILPTGQFGLITTIFNRASSSIGLNRGNPTVKDAGTQNGNGLTVGALSTGANSSNIESGTIIVLDAVPTATQDQRIKDRLLSRWRIQ